tara:strand:+ start:524 stop:706 length:183 start_codon:yes stop_codon:yes gene_type:complete
MSKKDKGEKVYIFTKIVKKRNSEYSISLQKKFKDVTDAISYAKENNYTIIDHVGKIINKN